MAREEGSSGFVIRRRGLKGDDIGTRVVNRHGYDPGIGWRRPGAVAWKMDIELEDMSFHGARSWSRLRGIINILFPLRLKIESGRTLAMHRDRGAEVGEGRVGVAGRRYRRDLGRDCTAWTKLTEENGVSIQTPPATAV